MIQIFYSYADQDESWQRKLDKHLSTLKRNGLISTWHARRIIPGTDWTQAADRHLQSASIILLFISPDFLDSDYCYGVEMQQALQRHATHEAYVIPILIRPIDWQETPFSHLQCLPHNQKPVTKWANKDDAFLDIVRGIREAINDINLSHGEDTTPSFFTSSSHALPPFPSPPSVLRDRQRQHLLAKVRKFWITGVLERSLHGAMSVTLGLHERPDAVANPWQLVLQQASQPEVPLPADTTITQVFEDAGSELLILGEPGSGKTTLLLQLTRDLLHRAQQDITHPLPVVFNLSSWAIKRQPIADWLVEELNSKYQVGRKLGQSWVDADKILPLLDGLDEVSPSYRAVCVDALNEYRQEHGLLPIVICSRSAAYLVQTSRLQLQTAVVIQPLTSEQVDQYLANGGERLAEMRRTLSADPNLQALTSTPLMLSIFALAYHEKSFMHLQGEATTAMRQQVFATYIRHMLERRTDGIGYPYQHTIRYLTSIAKQLSLHNQVEFYPERIQLDWLPKTWARQLHICAGLGLVYGLLTGVIFGLLNAMLYEPSFGLIVGIATGLLTGLVYGIINGIIYTLLDVFASKERPSESRKTLGRSMQQLLIQVMRSGLVLGLVCGISDGLLNVILLRPFHPPSPQTLSYGLIPALLFLFLDKPDAEIKPAEIITWSWTKIQQNLIKFMGCGLLLGLVYGLAYQQPGRLIVGLVAGLIFGLTGGLSSEISEKRELDTQNQGLLRSARNSMLSGLITGSIGGFLFGLTYGAFFGSTPGAACGTITGITLGVFVSLQNGGTGCIQYVILRLMLWDSEVIPWNLSRFLNYATEHTLLQKVGGWYIFIHRTLQDYFAALETTTMSSSLSRSSQPSAPSKRILFVGPHDNTPFVELLKENLRTRGISVEDISLNSQGTGQDDTDALQQAIHTTPTVILATSFAALQSIAPYIERDLTASLATARPVISSQPLTRRTVVISLGGLTASGALAALLLTYRLSNETTLGTILYTIYLNHTDAVFGIVWSPDSRYIASSGADQTVQVWNPTNGKPLWVNQDAQNAQNTGGVVGSVSWSPDSKHIAAACCSSNPSVLILNAESGKHNLIYHGHHKCVHGVTWSNNSKNVASAGSEGTVQIWDAASGNELIGGDRHRGSLWCVAWSPDGTRITLGTGIGYVMVLDASTGNLLWEHHSHSSTVNSLAWSHDSIYIASTGADNIARVWDANNGTAVRVYQGHTQPVYGVCWSPDNKRIATGSVDHTVQIWDPFTGRTLFTYTGHHDTVFGVAWSPDGTRIASGDGASTVQVWKAP